MIRRLFSSNALNSRKFLFVKEFKGEPTAANFELVKEDLSALKDGEVLTAAEFLSVRFESFFLVEKLQNKFLRSIHTCVHTWQTTSHLAQ